MLPSSDLIPASAPALVRTARLAEWLGVNPATIHLWVRCGVLPERIRLSKRIYMHRVDKVRAALDERARCIAERSHGARPA